MLTLKKKFTLLSKFFILNCYKKNRNFNNIFVILIEERNEYVYT